MLTAGMIYFAIVVSPFLGLFVTTTSVSSGTLKVEFLFF